VRKNIVSIQTALQKKQFWIAVIVFGILLKIALLPVVKNEHDFVNFLLPWVNFIKANGYFEAMKYPFYNYTPTYIYLLVLIAKIGINPVIGIKIVSILFEYLMAFFVGKIVQLKYPSRLTMLATLAIVPLIPTVLMNASYWHQCDAVYSAFAIGSIFFLLNKRSLLSIVFLGIAFAFKMQTAMLLPFFFVALLRGEVKWYYFLAVPAVYFLAILPTWFAGRPWADLLGIYLAQADTTHKLTLNFPNFYTWFTTPNLSVDDTLYPILMPVGIFVTVCVTIVCGILLSRKIIRFDLETWVRLAFLSAIVVPFLLPGMHERYMFLGDVLGVLYFLVLRRNIHLPLGIIFVSSYSYIRCSRLNEFMPMEPVFFIYLSVIVLAIIDFKKSLVYAK
jgi:Gpi18-like mannosyltransferase